MINRKWVQTKKTQLYTSIGSTATSILLKNAFRLDGSLLDMEDDFGAIGFMTLEPGGLKEEIISFTGLSYNISGTVLTLSGVVRGRKGEHPYTTGGTAYGHSANRVAIFTNNPQHYEGFANKYNEETITQVWTFTETERPKLDVDRDALLAEEFITLGQANRLIQATYLPPQIVASDSGTTGNVQAASLTISHTIPATIKNGGTFVVINTEENKTVSTVALGGVALTRVATKTRVTGNIRVEVWRLIAPASGTANLVITPSANAYITAHVISLSNVNQTTPEDALSTGADGSGTAVADSVTTTTQGALILMGVGTANDPTTFTPTAPLAEQEVNSATTNRPLSSSVRSTTTTGAYALAYTIAPTTNWVTKAVAIRGIASSNDNTVKASAADTTPDYLKDKIDITSNDGSVTITKTVQNPGGDEKLLFDLAAIGAGGSGGGTKLAIDTDEVSNATTTPVTAFTIPIPKDTLGDNDAIRFTITGSTDNGAGADEIEVLYGAQSLGTVTVSAQCDFVIYGVIIADNATGAQKTQIQLIINGSVQEVINGVLTVDSTANEDLEVSIVSTNVREVTLEAIIVEKISSGGSGIIISLDAGEDLTTGDTVGYASFIEDTAMKAVWAYRQNTYQPPLVTDETTYTGISGICEIDTDKYVVLVTNNASGVDLVTRALVVTLDRDTNICSFGVPVTFDRIGTDGISICKVATNKFAVAYFDANVNYEIVVDVGSVSGTTISFGTSDNYTSGDNGSTVDLVQLDTDRIAMLVTNASSTSVVDLFEVTFAGTVATIGTPTTAVTPANNNIGIIEKIATDKIAIIYNTTLRIATVSAGVWTLGTGITLPSSIDTNLQYGKLGIVSIVDDTLWISAELSNTIYYLYYTISGTVPTLVASGSYADASEECNTLLTDGTSVFLFAQSADATKSGIAKLTVNGATIDISPFAVLFDMGSAYVATIGMPLIKNNTIRGTDYYGIVNYSVTGTSRTIILDYHIKGMTQSFIGIAQGTVSRGLSVQVKIAGVDENQTGLTPGALYNPFEGGIVNTATQSFNTMQAQSPTDIKI